MARKRDSIARAREAAQLLGIEVEDEGAAVAQRE
jgi:hypothetical protein